MQSIWVEDPMQRPTFQQVLKELNSISPQKGDLMDNLVNMVRSEINKTGSLLLQFSLLCPTHPTAGEIFD